MSSPSAIRARSEAEEEAEQEVAAEGAEEGAEEELELRLRRGLPTHLHELGNVILSGMVHAPQRRPLKRHPFKVSCPRVSLYQRAAEGVAHPCHNYWR